tara:strand:- start:762 stop:1556 length:795 start_codon:yes stop_codon:yes gene_type:complete
MTETNTITIQTDDRPADPIPQHDSFAHCWRLANAFAASSMVPANFQNNPHDCFVVVQLAVELGISPLTAVQNVFMIGGRPSYTAKFAVALANRAKVFAGPIRWKINKGDKKEDLEVTAYAPLSDGDIAEVTLSWRIAAAEGWTRNKKYSTIPEQMLRWRSAKWLIDLHCPEILLGFDVVESAPFNDSSVTQRNEWTQRNESVKDLCRNNVSLQEALLQQNDQPVAHPVVITQGDPEKPALKKPAGEVSPAPSLAKKSEEDNEND